MTQSQTKGAFVRGDLPRKGRRQGTRFRCYVQCSEESIEESAQKCLISVMKSIRSSYLGWWEIQIRKEHFFFNHPSGLVPITQQIPFFVLFPANRL